MDETVANYQQMKATEQFPGDIVYYTAESGSKCQTCRGTLSVCQFK